MAKQNDVKKAIGKIIGPGPGGAATSQEQEQPEDPVKAYGIGLRVSEWETIDQIANDLGMNRHAVALWALRDFLKRYDAGEIQTVTQKTLPGL